MDITTLVEALDQSNTNWQATKALLTYWNARPADEVRPSAVGHCYEDYERWSLAKQHAEDRFCVPANSNERTLTSSHRGFLIDEMRGGERFVANGLAWGMDLMLWPEFLAEWRAECTTIGETHTLEPGDIYPVPHRGDQEIQSGNDRSSLPYAIDDPLQAELPHVRVYGSDDDYPDREIAITYDFSFRHVTLDALGHAEIVTGIHPNASKAEFKLRKGPSMYPVRVRDESLQVQRLKDLLRAAIDHGARIIVAPELALTERIADELQAFLDSLDTDDDILFVPGSAHIDVDGSPTNTAWGFVSGSSSRLVHRKIVPFTREARFGPVAQEGIEPGRRLNIYDGGLFRFAIVICKDFLEGDVRKALIRAGANIVLVPAMSRTTGVFPARAETLSSDGHALVAVANGPAYWGKVVASPVAVCSRPVRIDPCQAIAAPPCAKEAIGRSEFRLASGDAEWFPHEGG